MLNTATVLCSIFIYKLIRHFTIRSSTVNILVKNYLSAECYVSLTFNIFIHRITHYGI